MIEIGPFELQALKYILYSIVVIVGFTVIYKLYKS